MEIQLENLSVEDLKTLRTNINLLLQDKCKPKYKSNDCFINPDGLTLIHVIRVADNDVNGDVSYRVNVNDSNGNGYIRYVCESYIDKCLLISEEVYYSLIDYKDEILNKITDFKNNQDNERYDYRESLYNEFKEKLRKVINDQK